MKIKLYHRNQNGVNVFLKFIQRHPRSITAHEYIDQVTNQMCVPVEDAPCQDMLTIINSWVDPSDIKKFLKYVDYVRVSKYSEDYDFEV